MSEYEDEPYSETFPSGRLFRISYDSTLNRFKMRCYNSKDLDEMIEAFSDQNPKYFYMKQYGYDVEKTISVINTFGVFPTGLLFDILKHIKGIYGSLSVVEMSKNCRRYMSDYLIPIKSRLEGRTFDILNVSDESGRNGKLESEGSEPYLFREYQEEAIRRILFSGYGRGIIEVGTAGGKSFILANLVYNVLRKIDEKARFLILVPNVQLVFQMYGDFSDYGFDMSIVTKMTGKLKKTERFNPDAQIIIGNRQYVFGRMELLGKIDFLICDEVHTVLAEKTSEFIDKLNPRMRVGCTGSIPNVKYQKWMLTGIMGSVLFEKGIGDLQRDGYVSKMKLYCISVTDNSVKNDRNNLFHINPYRRYSPDENGYSEIPFNAAHDAEHDYYEKHYRELYRPVLEEISKYDGNTLLLFDRIEFGKKLTELSRGIFSCKKIHYIDGSVPVSERIDITRQIEDSGDNVLFAEFATYSTGINAKRLTNLVFISSSKSFPRILQSIGRTLRLHATKKESRIFDVSFYPFKYSQRHLRERLRIYKEVYNKTPDETIRLEI